MFSVPRPRIREKILVSSTPAGGGPRASTPPRRRYIPHTGHQSQCAHGGVWGWSVGSRHKEARAQGGAPTGGPRRTSCACRASRFWRPGGISRHSFTLSGISWCQSTDLMEYIKMNQVPFNFMKVEPSHDGPDYSRLTEPEPSPSSGRAVPTRTHLCWPPGPK